MARTRTLSGEQRGRLPAANDNCFFLAVVEQIVDNNSASLGVVGLLDDAKASVPEYCAGLIYLVHELPQPDRSDVETAQTTLGALVEFREVGNVGGIGILGGRRAVRVLGNDDVLGRDGEVLSRTKKVPK